MTPADLAELLKSTASAVLAEHDLDESALPQTVTVERPRNPEHGDYASNLALQLGKKVGINPRELAGWLAEALQQADGIADAEVAGPGFINMRLETSAQATIVTTVIDQGTRFGHSDDLAGHKINLEFVSANPTGPMHIGGTRWAAVGDALARLLQARAPTSPASTTSTTTAPRSTGSPARCWPRPSDEPAPGTATAGDYIAEIAAQVLDKAPDALSLPERRGAGDLPRDRRRADVRRDQGVAARVRRRLRRLLPRELAAQVRRGRPGRRPAAGHRQLYYAGRRAGGCAPPISATTRTAS